MTDNQTSMRNEERDSALSWGTRILAVYVLVSLSRHVGAGLISASDGQLSAVLARALGGFLVGFLVLFLERMRSGRPMRERLNGGLLFGSACAVLMGVVQAWLGKPL